MGDKELNETREMRMWVLTFVFAFLGLVFEILSQIRHGVFVTSKQVICVQKAFDCLIQVPHVLFSKKRQPQQDIAALSSLVDALTFNVGLTTPVMQIVWKLNCGYLGKALCWILAPDNARNTLVYAGRIVSAEPMAGTQLPSRKEARKNYDKFRFCVYYEHDKTTETGVAGKRVPA